MPSKKVLAILIVCISGVLSSWLVSSTPSLQDVKNSQKETSVSSVSASPYEKLTSNTSDDWKKMLNSVDTKNQPVEKAIKTNEDTFDETSITAKLSVDMMSRYLSLKSSGKQITSEDLNNIASNVLDNPEYTTLNGAKYRILNLKIAKDSDQNSITIYKTTVKTAVSKAFSQIKEDPYVTMAKAIKQSSPNQLNNLDSAITACKTIISDLLNISVPKEAVTVHLNLLNSFSKMLADLESLHLIFDDPVKSLNGINQYDSDKIEFINAVDEMSKYILKK